jgi:hypothetical protein
VHTPSRIVVVMAEGEADEVVAAAQISRRKMLAGMGAVGVGAWAAPVIVDSILNPAYAFGSKCAGCASGKALYRTSFTVSATAVITKCSTVAEPPSGCVVQCYDTGSPTNDCTQAHSTITAAVVSGSTVKTTVKQASGTGRVVIDGAFTSNGAAPCTQGTGGGTATMTLQGTAPYTVFVSYCD